MAETAKIIDFDANATTPIDERVLEAMRPHLLSGGNPESRHGLGRRSRRAWDDARELIAALLGAHVDELVLTSGGTEANNAALFGLLHEAVGAAGHDGERRVLCSPIEHPAVNGPLELLNEQGRIRLEKFAVGCDGVVDPAEVGRAIEAGPKPILITLMLANNETGAIQPIMKVAEKCNSAGITFHTDAVQAVGRVDVHFNRLGVTTLAAGSHKMHGPPGIGLLIVKKGVRLKPLIIGGGQQKERRAGTPPVALAVGLAEALRLFDAEKVERHLKWRHFQKLLLDELRLHLSGKTVSIEFNGPEDSEKQLPQTMNLWFNNPLINGELALMKLDLAGLAVSLGSACASGSMRPSPVLLAMGCSQERAKNSIRVSFSANTTEEEIRRAAKIMAETVIELITETE